MLLTEHRDFTLQVTKQDWDSEVLGYHCGSLAIDLTGKGPDVNADDFESGLKETLAAAKKQGFRFLTAKIDSHERTFANGCFRNGGTLIDVEMTLAKVRADAPRMSDPAKEFSVRKVSTYWDDSLYELAAAFTDSRFFVDQNIGREAALKLWRTSLYNNCNGRASYSVLCFEGAKPVGVMNIFEREQTSDIFLIALLPSYQGKGLGSAMIDHYERGLGRSITRQTVETQVGNYRAQNLYARMGYRCAGSKYLIHFWL